MTPLDTVREALLPCPFCGKDKPNISYKHIDITPGERVGTIWDVTCWNCGAEKARYDSEEHAIAAWNTRAALEAQLATTKGCNMNEEQIRYMASRFLGWKLPKDFNPDGGVTFDPVFNKGTPQEMRHETSGTNLFHIGQAEDMVRYMVEGLPDNKTQLAREPVSLHDIWKVYCASTGWGFENTEKKGIRAILDHLGIPHDRNLDGYIFVSREMIYKFGQ